MSEISQVYKVGDLEFSTAEEAQAYIDSLNSQKVIDEAKEAQRLLDIAEIEKEEKVLRDLYSKYEENYTFLPDRSNNLKELLKEV